MERVGKRDRGPARRARLTTAGGPLPLLLALCAACDRSPRRPPPKPDPPAPPALELAPREGASPVRFVDATAESGLDFVHDYGAQAQQWRYVETLGSGVVAFDGDGDGDVDLLFLNGRGFGEHAAPPRGNAYFRNEGALRFVEATAEAGLAGNGGFALGGCAADYDGDGDQDLYVVHFGSMNVLYRNDGGRFADVTAAAGVPGLPDGVDSVAVFGDANGDGRLDLFVGGCVDQTLTKHRECWDAEYGRPENVVRRYCNPIDFEPIEDRLYLSNGDGTFRDGTAEAGLAGFRGRTLGALFIDVDDDGDQDLFVTCDRTPNALWLNDGAGRFEEVAHRAGVALDREGRAQGGMGLGAGDLDGDGTLELVATYFERESNGVYRRAAALDAELDAELHYDDVAQAANVAHASFAALGWGMELLDADLDGDLDWIVANGHVHPHIEFIRRPGRTLGWEQPLLFHLNRGGGVFESLGAQAGPAFEQRYAGRGLACADLDDDGDLDVVLGTNGAAARLLRNDSPRAGNHWLRVRLAGAGGNRDGLGARVIVEAGGRRQRRDVHAGGSYFSQSDPRPHFGLGPATLVDRLEVRWPDGTLTELRNLPPDQTLTLTY